MTMTSDAKKLNAVLRKQFENFITSVNGFASIYDADLTPGQIPKLMSVLAGTRDLVSLFRETTPQAFAEALGVSVVENNQFYNVIQGFFDVLKGLVEGVGTGELYVCQLGKERSYKELSAAYLAASLEERPALIASWYQDRIDARKFFQEVALTVLYPRVVVFAQTPGCMHASKFQKIIAKNLTPVGFAAIKKFQPLFTTTDDVESEVDIPTSASEIS